jgi:DNA-binding MarR family transcriptional regulator
MARQQIECASRVVEVVPIVMRHLRANIRSQKSLQFTIPQFRVLVYLHLNGYATLSELAASQGVSLPTMSKLVGSLVQRKLVAREGHGADRRKLKLQLTTEGQRAHDATLQNTREYVAAKVVSLTEQEQAAIVNGLTLLVAVFEPVQTKAAAA